jgi:hypothetical protein
MELSCAHRCPDATKEQQYSEEFWELRRKKGAPERPNELVQKPDTRTTTRPTELDLPLSTSHRHTSHKPTWSRTRHSRHFDRIAHNSRPLDCKLTRNGIEPHFSHKPCERVIRLPPKALDCTKLSRQISHELKWNRAHDKHQRNGVSRTPEICSV